MVHMRDGTRLAASVTYPDESGPFPAILVRTPYDKTNQAPAAARLAEFGYAVVRQDVRGRFDSEGEFYPFRDDPQDGYDTIEWVAEQPWCNGKVGTMGGSHVGTVQYLAVLAAPPHLTTCLPEIAPASVYHYWWYHGGAFRLCFNLAWLVLLAQDNSRHFPARVRQLADARSQLWVTPEQMKALEISPLWREWSLQNVPWPADVFGNSWFEDFMGHAEYDSFWHPTDFRRHHEKMTVPMLHVGGWYDTFGQGTIDSYVGMVENAGSEEARRGQRLVVGPWRHAGFMSGSVVGDVDFGPNLPTVDQLGLRLRWYDQWLKGENTGLLDEPPVLIFVMGDNVWRAEESWPLVRARSTRYYLHSDGTLSTTAPGESGSLSFDYDPYDPVPTIGGPEWVNFPCGPFDQRPLDGRKDVLRFQTPPLEDDLEVTGRISVELDASSSAVDTDFTAKLIDVHPDGTAYNLCDGILRARYRDSFERPSLLEPGRPYRFIIDLWSTSNVFKRGHRIRLDISSSNFPRFDVNPNNGGSSLTGSREGWVVARNTIYCDSEHPSHVILPIVPR